MPAKKTTRRQGAGRKTARSSQSVSRRSPSRTSSYEGNRYSTQGGMTERDNEGRFMSDDRSYSSGRGRSRMEGDYQDHRRYGRGYGESMPRRDREEGRYMSEGYGSQGGQRTGDYYSRNRERGYEDEHRSLNFERGQRGYYGDIYGDRDTGEENSFSYYGGRDRINRDYDDRLISSHRGEPEGHGRGTRRAYRAPY